MGGERVTIESVLLRQRGRKSICKSQSLGTAGVPGLRPREETLQASEGRFEGLRGLGRGRWRLGRARELRARTAATSSTGSVSPSTTR